MIPFKVGVEIKRVKDSDGKDTLKAAVPLGIIFEKDFDASLIENETEKFELKYKNLVDTLKSIYAKIKDRKAKSRVLAYWEFGNLINRFIEENEKGIFILDAIFKHLTRDIGVSEKLVLRTRRFNKHYPNKAKIDPQRSFDSYVATFEGGYVSKNRKRERK